MAKIKLEDLVELGSKLGGLSKGWGLGVSTLGHSKKACAFNAGYRDGFTTGLAALCHAAKVHAEGGELNESAHERTYGVLEWIVLQAYLAESEED